MIIDKIKNLALSSTAKSTYITSISDIGLAILAAGTTALVARQLTASEFGLFIALWTFLTLIASLLDLGIGSGIIAFVSKTNNVSQQNQYIGSSFIFLTIIGFIQFLIISFGSKIWQILLFPNTSTNLIILVGIGSWLLIIGRFSNDALRAKQKFTSSAFSTLSFAVIRLTLIATLIYLGMFNLSNAVTIMCISPVFYFISAFIMIKIPKHKLKIHLHDLRKLLKFSSWLGVNQAITTGTSRIDILLLNRLSSSANAGIYGTASLMARIYLIITSSLLAVFAPKLVQIKNYQDQKKFLFKIILIVLLVWSTMLILGAIAKPLIIIIFGPKYLPSLPVFYLLITAMAALIASIPVILPIIYILKKPQIVARLSSVQFIIVLISNILLIPKFGLYVPAYSLIFTQILILLAGLWYIKDWLTNNSQASS